jgi:hypothetical protein
MAATDLLTPSEARSAVNLPGGDTSHDVDLQLYITGISGRVDAICGPVVERTVSSEKHNGGRSKILLDVQHVASVTSVSEWSNTTETALTEESNTTKPTSGFLLHTVTPYDWIIRRSGNSDASFPSGRNNVVVTYEAGRYADTAAVDETFKLAASSILRRIWKREQSSWSQTTDFFADTEQPAAMRGFFRAVDPMVKELLADEVLPPVGL